MLFVFLDFNLDLGTVRLGLIPSFLGYIMMLGGVVELQSFSHHFSRVRPFVKTMIYLEGLAYAINFFGLWQWEGIELLVTVYGLALLICSLMIAYRIIMGIKDMEEKTEKTLNSGRLYSAWNTLTILSLIACLLFFIPVLWIAYLIFSILYLLEFNKTKKLYYECGAPVRMSDDPDA